MFIRKKDKANGKTAVQIVETHRSGKKVSQKIYRHIGQATNEKELNEPKRLAQTIIEEFKEQRKPYTDPIW
ncbi:MAG: hypothetical protein H7844_13455 [Nitrospirae bacterium YQR-1]